MEPPSPGLVSRLSPREGCLRGLVYARLLFVLVVSVCNSEVGGAITVSASAAATQAESCIAALYCEADVMSRASAAGSSRPRMKGSNKARRGISLDASASRWSTIKSALQS